MNQDIRHIKQRFSFTPAQLELVLDILAPIVGDRPMRDDHNDIIRLNIMITDMIDKVYAGIKRPERIPVSNADRQRAKPFSTNDLGFSSNELSSGSLDTNGEDENTDPNHPDFNKRKIEVVGYQTFEDALKASRFNNEDEMNAYASNMSMEEYMASKNSSKW